MKIDKIIYLLVLLVKIIRLYFQINLGNICKKEGLESFTKTLE